MKDILLAVATVFSSILIVLCLILLGWYIVWKLFLSRFRFVRELLGGSSTDSTAASSESSRPRAKRSRRD